MLSCVRARFDPSERERTRLAWRRTVLAATVVSILAARLAIGSRPTTYGALGVAVLALLWLAVVGVPERRIHTLAAAHPPSRPPSGVRRRSSPGRSWRTPCSALRCWPCADDEIWAMISAMGRLFVLFALADLLLLAVALIDCLSCEDYEIRALPKVAWVLVVLLFSPVGGIAWFMAGRPQRPDATRPRARRADGATARQRRPLAPDDDPEFLRDLADRIRRDDAERLRRWEEDLRRREEELRRRQSTDDTDG